MTIFYDKYATEREMAKSGVSWFKFDESSGNVTDSKGTAVGTVTGATRVAGVSGNALSFNGTSDYVQFNSSVIPIGKKSIRFRIKTSDASSTTPQRIIDTTNNSADRGFSILVFEGKIRILNRIGAGLYNILVTSNKIINDGQWHDVLFTWNGLSGGIASIYIDDMTNPSNTITAISNDLGGYNNLRIGMSNFVNGEYLNGQLDELEIYNDIINPFSYKTLILSENSYKKITEKVIEGLYDSIKKIISSVPSTDEFTLEVDSEYSSTPAWKMFSKTNIDRVDCWLNNSTNGTGHIIVEYKEPKNIRKYSITSRNDTIYNTFQNTSPKQWKLLASNNEVDWIELDSKTKTSWTNSELYEITITNSEKFKFYKLDILSTVNPVLNSYYVSIGELYLYEYKEYKSNEILVVSQSIPTQEQFLTDGMNELSPLLDRQVETLAPISMVDNTITLLPSGDVGKVFSATIDLNKYFDIRKIEVK